MLTRRDVMAAHEERRARGRDLLREARTAHGDARREAARLMGLMDGTSDPEPVLRQFEHAIRRLVQAEDAAR